MAGPAHVFYEAVEHGADYELEFLQIEKGVASTSSGLNFARLIPFRKSNLQKGDMLFIPGFDTEYLFDHQYLAKLTPFFKWLRSTYESEVSLCSVCTGAFILAEAGLLDNSNCTTHWKYFDHFEKRFPKTSLQRNRLFTDENHIYTSAGISSGIDLSLYIIEKHMGSKFAQDIAREVVVYMRRSEEDPQLSIFLQYRNHLEDRIHQIQDYITKHIAEKINLDTLADLIHTSERNLTRLFKNTTGITIGEYMDRIKAEYAHQLITEGNKMSYVATQCGFQTTNQLYRLLKKHRIDLPD